MENKSEHLELTVYRQNGFSQMGYQLVIVLKHRNIPDGENYRWNRLFLLIGSQSSDKEFVNNNFNKIVEFLDTNILVPFESEVSKNILQKTYTIDIDYKEQILVVLDQRPNIESDTKPYTPKLLKFEEKHGDRYYLLTSLEQAKTVYLKVLTERFDEDWYTWMKNYKPYELVKLEFTQKDIDELKDSLGVKNQLTKQLQDYERKLDEQEETRELYKSIESAVKEKNGVKAESILRDLKDGEYEGMVLIDFDNDQTT